MWSIILLVGITSLCTELTLSLWLIWFKCLIHLSLIVITYLCTELILWLWITCLQRLINWSYLVTTCLCTELALSLWIICFERLILVLFHHHPIASKTDRGQGQVWPRCLYTRIGGALMSIQWGTAFQWLRRWVLGMALRQAWFWLVMVIATRMAWVGMYICIQGGWSRCGIDPPML